MIVYTTHGSVVSLVDTNKKSLFDNNGVEWARCPEYDNPDPFAVGYRETKSNASVIKLNKEEIRRVIKGVNAMRTPTTVLEMRYHALNLPMDYQRIIDEWPDQKLREILVEAEEHGSNPGQLLEKMADKELEKQREPESAPENPTEATEEATETRRAQGTARNTPRSRKQEGSVSVALGEVSVLLTPKQLEFIERLSECPGWDRTGVTGEYIASEYAQELSDTMNPMSVGAVLTTLREKGLVSTEKRRVGAIKCCVFRLTDLGVNIYNKLAGRG